MSDQTIFQSVQSNLGDSKHKQVAMTDKLKELIHVVENGSLNEISQILEENEFDEKSLNRVFTRAFNSPNIFKETFKGVVDLLLK